MSPSTPSPFPVLGDLRQTVCLPRESDGVGNALRQIFTGAPALPCELTTLLACLNKED